MKGRGFWTRGTTIGTAIGLVAVFLTTLPFDSLGEWSTGDSLIFGLLSTATGVLWEVNARQQRRVETMDRTSRLMVALEGSEFDEDPLVVLCESAAKIKKKMGLPTYIRENIEDEIGDLSKRLDDLADHSFLNVHGERPLMTLVNACAADASRYVYATSAADGVDELFWESPVGKDYLWIQQRLLTNGVKVRRIFFTASREFTPEVLAWMNQQEALGIEVGARSNSPDTEDFIVFDNRAAVLTQLAPGGHSVAGGRIDFSPAEVAKHTELFNQWWERATEEWSQLKASIGDLR